MHRTRLLMKLNSMAMIAIFAACWTASPVFGQESASDLRRQNQLLASQIETLEKELDLARQRNGELEGRIAQLERELAARRAAPPASTQPTSPPLDEEEITVDESIPNASPRALFNAIIASHDEAMADMDWGAAGDRNRRAYLKKLDGWRNGVNRQFRSPIKWYVRVVDGRISPAGHRIITLVAVDPQTDVRLGNPFQVVLTQNLVDRLARYEARGELDVLILRGTLVPEVHVNEERLDRGSFDNPPLIGPFAEFMYRVDVASLVLPREELKEPAPPASTRPAMPGNTEPAPVEPMLEKP